MANTIYIKWPKHPWMPKAWIMLWYYLHSNRPAFLIYAASLFYWTHIINVWGCTEILPTHCGTGSVKVNYYRCMREIWGLVKPHKVNKLWDYHIYYRICSNTVCTMKKKHKISLHKYSFYSQKSYFRCTLSDLCGVLTSRVNNLRKGSWLKITLLSQ